MKKKYTIVYKIKMKEFDYRILISAMSAYRQKQIANGEDTTEINKLLLNEPTLYRPNEGEIRSAFLFS